MRIKHDKLISAIAYPLLLTAIVGAAWFLAATAAGSEFLLPTPQAAIKKLGEVLTQDEFYSAFFFTLWRAVLSYFASGFFAIVLAFLSLYFIRLRKLLAPLVSVLRALPTMAIVLLLVIWTNARTAPIIVALMVIFPTLYSLFLEALLNVNKHVIDMAKIDGANKLVLTFKFYLPLMTPHVARSTAAAISLTVKLMVAAEVLSMTAHSLGAMMQIARIYFETAELMALTLITVLASLILEWLLLSIIKLTYRSWN